MNWHDNSLSRKQPQNRYEPVQTQTPRARRARLALIAVLMLAFAATTPASSPERAVLSGSGELDKAPSYPARTKAGPGDIDFESDPGDNHANGFVSVDDSRAVFSDSMGEHLQTDLYGPWSDGHGLRIGDNDPSYLIIEFAEPVATLSLDFGNDQPSMSNPGDEAVLSLFLGNHQIGQVSVVLNRNGDMDQTITYEGECFNTATFIFDVSTAGEAEIVDNIQFETCGEAGSFVIPAVSKEGLFVLVIMVLVLGWRYRPRELESRE